MAIGGQEGERKQAFWKNRSDIRTAVLGEGGKKILRKRRLRAEAIHNNKEAADRGR